VRDVLGDDRASDIEDQSPEDFADSRGVVITNNRGRSLAVANGNGSTGMTKADLEDSVDQALDILQAAYTPEASREELAAAVGDAIDALSGEDTGDED